MKPIADPSVSLLARLRHLGQQQGLPLDAAVIRCTQRSGTPSRRAVRRTILTTDFAADEVLAGRWRQFLRRAGLSAPAEFAETMQLLNPFPTAILPDGDGMDEQTWNPQQRQWERG